MITNVRKFGEGGPFMPIETDDCACCEAARAVRWVGPGVIFLEVEGGPIRRVEYLGAGWITSAPSAFLCVEVTPDDARAEIETMSRRAARSTQSDAVPAARDVTVRCSVCSGVVSGAAFIAGARCGLNGCNGCMIPGESLDYLERNLLTPGPDTDKLLAALEASGMRRTKCANCGCDLLTRSGSEVCPPCRDEPQSSLALPPAFDRILARVVAARMFELGGVLARMVELMGAGQGATFGDALAQACTELDVRVHKGSEDESALLTTCFQIISSGRIPGAPDA